MARIMKVRTIPRGYVHNEDMRDFVTEKNAKSPAEWFMALYNKFGNPQEGGVWSYLLRHNSIVLKVTAVDNVTMDFDMWVSPGVVLDAKRKRTRAINIVARRLNEENIIFVPEKDDNIYYAIRRKNDELRRKETCSDDVLREKMDEAITDKERYVLSGPLSQFMDDAKNEITNTIGEIFNGK